MSIDLGGLFDLGKSMVNSAVDSAGTVVEFFTETSNGLQAPTRTVLRKANAIQNSVGNWNTSASEVLPGLVLTVGDWKITCKAGTPIPPENSLLKIIKTRNTPLLNREALFLGVKTDSSGAHVTLYYRPRA